MLRLIAKAGGAILLAVYASLAVGQVPKSGQIGQIIVGVPPGSNLDATARILADHMSETGGQRYIVLNRPGSGGAIGAEVVARSPPTEWRCFSHRSRPW